MQAGFLGVITNPTFPDRIKIITWNSLPQKVNGRHENGIRYITKFNDILAAKMHLHQALRHHLLDANNDLYQTTLLNAVAAIESNDHLRQERIWIDSHQDTNFLNSVTELTTIRRLKTKRINFAIQLVGFSAIGLLALNFYSSIG